MSKNCEIVAKSIYLIATDVKYENRYKGISINPLDITDDVIFNILNNGLDSIKDKRISTYFKYKTYTLNKIIDKINSEENKNNEFINNIKQLLDKEELHKVGVSIKEVAITLQALLSMNVSQHNIVEKKLKNKDKNKVQTEDGRYYFSANTFKNEIGKQILRGYGKTLRDTYNGDLVDNHIKLAEPVINYLIDKGYINKLEDKPVVLNGQMDEKGNYIKSDKDLPYGTKKFKNVFTIGSSITSKFLEEQLKPSSKKTKIKDKVDDKFQENLLLNDLIKKLYKLSMPIKEQPFRTSQTIYEDKVNENDISTLDILRQESDMDFSEDSISYKATKDLMSKAYYIDDAIKPYLIDMANKLEKEINDINFSLPQFIKGNKIDEFFGFEKELTIKTFEEEASTTGKERTSLDTLMLSLASMVDKHKENSELTYENILSQPYYIGKFRGKNARTYITEQVFNPESDKRLARLYTTVSKNKFKLLLKDNDNSFSQETVDTIHNMLEELFGYKVNENDFKNFINYLDNSIELDKDNQFYNLTREFKLFTNEDKEFIYTHTLQFINDSEPYSKRIPSYNAKIIQSILELKELKGNGILTTHYIPELDANNSGPMIKLQLAANSGSIKAQEILYRFGLYPNSNGEYISKENGGEFNNKFTTYLPGVYELTMEELDKIFNPKIDDSIIDKDIKEKAINNALTKNISYINKVIIGDSNRKEYTKEDLLLARDLWNNVDNKRNLAKKPTMVVGAYDMEASSASKLNVVPEMYSEMKSEWLNSTTKFKEFINLIDKYNKLNEVFDVIPRTDKQQTLKDYLLSLNKEQISTILLNKQVEENIKDLIDTSIGQVLTHTAQYILKDNVFGESNNLLKDIWKNVVNLFGYDSKNGFNPEYFKQLDLEQLAEHFNTTEPEIISNKIKELYSLSKLNHKNFLHLTKTRNELLENEVEIQKDMYNFPTLTVSTIHMYDSAILHKSLLDLKEWVNTNGSEIDKQEFNNSNILTVHDAILINPKFANKIQELYIKNQIKITNNIDKDLLYISSLMGQVIKDKVTDKLSQWKKEHTYKNDVINTTKKEILNRKKEITSKAKVYIKEYKVKDKKSLNGKHTVGALTDSRANINGMLNNYTIYLARELKKDYKELSDKIIQDTINNKWNKIALKENYTLDKINELQKLTKEVVNDLEFNIELNRQRELYNNELVNKRKEFYKEAKSELDSQEDLTIEPSSKEEFYSYLKFLEKSKLNKLKNTKRINVNSLNTNDLPGKIFGSKSIKVDKLKPKVNIKGRNNNQINQYVQKEAKSYSDTWKKTIKSTEEFLNNFIIDNNVKDIFDLVSDKNKELKNKFISSFKEFLDLNNNESISNGKVLSWINELIPTFKISEDGKTKINRLYDIKYNEYGKANPEIGLNSGNNIDKKTYLLNKLVYVKLASNKINQIKNYDNILNSNLAYNKNINKTEDEFINSEEVSKTIKGC